MFRATDIAHLFVGQCLQSGDWAIDATMGNGNDTLFLSRLVGATGLVLAFDPQAAAHQVTRQLFEAELQLPENVHFIEAGHETMAEYFPLGNGGELRCVMFNLGYLPGGDRQFITRPHTTRQALQAATHRIAAGGILTLVCYPGHDGGPEESAVALEFCRQLPSPWKVFGYECLNARGPAPYLLIAQRGELLR